MKIAILTAFNPFETKGGIETFIINLIELFNEQKIQNDVIYLYSNPVNKNNVLYNILRKLCPPFLCDCFKLGRQFKIIENNYDLVISNNFYGVGYIPKKTRAINIYHSTHAGYANALKDKIHQNEYRQLKYYFGHVGDRISGYKKFKIAVSNSIQKELSQHYGFKDVMVIPHGIDTEFYTKNPDTKSLRLKWGISDDAFVGIFVGRWEIGKGIDILTEIILSHPEIFWIIVTGNTECPLDNLTHTKVIKDADKNDLKELYSLSDFMLFPSYYEGFGLVILEAMACELPVICTDVGVCKELKNTKEIPPLVIDLTNKNQMINDINSVISLLKNKDFSIKTGKALRKIVMQDYNLSVWKDNFLRVIYELK